MEIYLIRHGEAVGSDREAYDLEKRSNDPALTPNGIEQAHCAGKRLANTEFDMVYTSDKRRAEETAAIINTYVQGMIEVTPLLREIDMGDITTYGWARYSELYKTWVKHDEDIPYPNGENGHEVWKRSSVLIKEVLNKQYKRVAFVTHGGTIRSIICGVLNIPQEKRFFFGNPPENCCVSILKYLEEEDRFYMHSFNGFSHLYKK